MVGLLVIFWGEFGGGIYLYYASSVNKELTIGSTAKTP